MLCGGLEKYYSFPGFTLLLGSLFHTKLAGLGTLGSRFHSMEVHLYMIRYWGDGHIIEDSGFPRNSDYAAYFVELLESPERSGTHIFDQKRYATAAKECLQLYLCSHRDFSKGATEFACHDKAICRSKPWAWVARLGVHSRIRKGRRHFKALQRHSIEDWRRPYPWGYTFPENSPEHRHYRFLSYRWALDLLPFLLEQSPVSLELADVLRGHTLAMMAWRFPRSMRLAKEAIGKYLLRVDSAVGDP
jgi:hypothetical protein